MYNECGIGFIFLYFICLFVVVCLLILNMLDNDESFSMSGIQPTRFLASRQRGQAVSTGQNLKSGFCIPSRMKPDGRLTGHQGCVNTVSWSRGGDLLLSGSDDCQLNIYQWNR